MCVVDQDNLFLLTSVEAVNPVELGGVFESLSFDLYCKGNYRLRALSRYWVRGNKLVPRPHERFFQSGRVNKLWGGMYRDFPEAEMEGNEFELVEKLAMTFLGCCACDPADIELQVHPIRTLCSATRKGRPAPEGIHSDGYMFTSIYLVQRHPTIEGGITYLYNNVDGGTPVFEKQLVSGELLVINDEKLFHNTTEIATSNSETCSRDVIVFTLSPKDCDPESSYSR